MEERSSDVSREDNLITEILLPTIFTIVIILCLAQMAAAVFETGLPLPEGPGRVTAVSAFGV